MSIMDKNKELQKVLKELRNSVSGNIEASVIVDVQGLPISSDMPENINEGIIAAMTATILSVSENALKELQRGEINKVLVEGKDGSLILMNAGPNAILAVLVKQKTNLGLLFLVMRRAAENISAILS
ncbi:MAG: roadblock/LC7 domain-containing protein [Candidatus Odinarchaeota archaeon]|nr:roadblock/LC7 domain-containing protein [Candidatus Odinarchaeota archaeon]